MQLTFTKHNPSKFTLQATRPDGSKTWVNHQHDFLLIHDLVHFAVERELDLGESFYGQVAAGNDMSDFADKDKRDEIYASLKSDEAIVTEHIVSLIQTEKNDGKLFGNFEEELEKILSDQNLNFRPIHLKHKIENIRTFVNILLDRWDNLAYQDSMKLDF